MASTSEQLAWLERVYTEDTMLALELLCIADEACPELIELQRSLLHIQLLVSIHRLRLLGVEVARHGRMWVLEMQQEISNG